MIKDEDFLRLTFLQYFDAVGWALGNLKDISHKTSGSAIAEEPHEALVSRNPATTKHLT